MNPFLIPLVIPLLMIGISCRRGGKWNVVGYAGRIKAERRGESDLAGDLGKIEQDLQGNSSWSLIWSKLNRIELESESN